MKQDRLYEYTGLDIINEIKEDTYRLVFAIGNHEYSDYEGLKLLIKAVMILDNDKIPLIVDSLTNLELSMLEKNNALASIGYNKRVHDFCSIVCALNDSGYKFNSESDCEILLPLKGIFFRQIPSLESMA